MEFKKQFSVLGEQIRELLKKLTFSQKVTIGLLSVLIAVSLIMVVSMGRGESFVPLGMGQDPEELQRVKILLDQHNIPFHTIERDGGESIEVPRSQARGILLLAAENGMIGAKDTNMEWLFGEGSLFTTASQMDNRILESRKRSVADAIRWNSSVRDARIVVDLGPKPIYTLDTRSNNTASVSVALRPGVEKLSRSEARAIRKLVSGAFNILTKNIQVVDDKLHIYDPLDEDNPYLSEEEDRRRRDVQTTVERLLKPVFHPGEFVVGVILDVSSQKSQVMKVTYDRDTSVTLEKATYTENETNVRPTSGPVGVKPNSTGGLSASTQSVPPETLSRDKKIKENENFPSKVEESIQVPAGELKAISVNVVLDRSAIRRVLQEEEFTRFTVERREAEGIESEPDSVKITNFTVEGTLGNNNLDEAIESYRVRQTGFLADQLPMSGAKVSVTAVMFPRQEMPIQVAGLARAMQWAAAHWSDLFLGVVALVGLFVVYRMFQRTLPQPLDIPALDETVLEAESRAGDEEVSRLEAAIAEAGEVRAEEAAKAAPSEIEEEAQKLLETLEVMNDLLRDNPETASSVVRLWMNEWD